jgi:hypothetical protein
MSCDTPRYLLLHVSHMVIFKFDECVVYVFTARPGRQSSSPSTVLPPPPLHVPPTTGNNKSLLPGHHNEAQETSTMSFGRKLGPLVSFFCYYSYLLTNLKLLSRSTSDDSRVLTPLSPPIRHHPLHYLPRLPTTPTTSTTST